MSKVNVVRDISEEAEARRAEIVDKLSKPTINGKNTFQDAKKHWSKLENAFDDRINQLNKFAEKAESAFKKADERFSILQASLRTLQTESTTDAETNYALVSLPIFDEDNNNELASLLSTPHDSLKEAVEEEVKHNQERK